ncbi:MAG: hypothetical protein IID48_00355 [Proteobacteria bacterium]|nr:hypothetical protein [Pseudomonadota bacterium]
MTKRAYGFHLLHENQYGTERVVCRLMVRVDDSESPINPNNSAESTIWDAPKRFDGYGFDGFVLDGFVAEMNGSVSLIGFGPEFREVFSADVRCVAAMHKTMQRATKAMLRDQARDPGDIYTAVAKALGLSFAVRKIENPSGGCDYRDHRWQWMSVEEGRNELRHMIVTATTRKEEAA